VFTIGKPTDSVVLEAPVGSVTISNVGQSSFFGPSKESPSLNADNSTGFCGFDEKLRRDVCIARSLFIFFRGVSGFSPDILLQIMTGFGLLFIRLLHIKFKLFFVMFCFLNNCVLNIPNSQNNWIIWRRYIPGSEESEER
jgi:hypothetical protein